MTTNAFSFFSSIFGCIVAAISLLAFIINTCRSHLPSNKIKKLESLLDETETFFRKAVEDGLLLEPEFVRGTERHLTILRTRTYVLQSSAYNATTLRKDYAEFLSGTASAIKRTCDSLKELRAQVVVSGFPFHVRSSLLTQISFTRHLVRRVAVDGREGLSALIPSATPTHHHPLRFLVPVRVLQCFQDENPCGVCPESIYLEPRTSVMVDRLITHTMQTHIYSQTDPKYHLPFPDPYSYHTPLDVYSCSA
ncbi:hypothetical protein JVT61DRAFT_14178 [Boletus reticuloceps]|uniref:Uncharacterized protein n=1 Tax=Boletus reticuloceps TaxID=495285 RepID=A0A8I2YD07_9AGAM|nr:hypothetical protein JVT61DRAFT_14178 [Boletus reticuloceps]